MATIMVTGSRNWWSEDVIADVLGEWPEGTYLIHGDCRGADRIAARIGESLGFKVVAYPPSRDIPSPRRYHARNDAMLDESPDVVYAFRLNNGFASPGTDSVIRKARKRGLDVVVTENP